MSNSEDIVLEGYVSNTDLPIYDFSKTEDTIIGSVTVFRSTIYSTALEYISDGLKNPKLLKFTGNMLADSPFTAISIAMDAKDEGVLQATITGIGAAGVTSYIGIRYISPWIASLSTSPLGAFAISAIAAGTIMWSVGKLLDGIYDFGKEKLSEIRINEEQKSLIIETTMTNANDLKTLIEPLVLFGKVEENVYLNEIIINQNIDGETNTYIVQKDNTIWGICEKYGMTYDELIEANPWLAERFSTDRSFALIRPEESLIIPNQFLNTEEYFLNDKHLLYNDLFDTASHTAPVKIDPLILDLNGDGLNTTTLENGIYFDHDNNGFAEKSAWVGKDDGILVYDKNNNGLIDNGSEIFGDSFVKSDGTTATGGFDALSSLDSNSDSVINSSDEEFANIRILKGDGTLISLEDAGIVSISLSTTFVNTDDENGNRQLHVGSYTTVDGNTYSAADYNFVRDTMYSQSTDIVEISDEIKNLPDAKGYGVVETLHQAMAKDETGGLKSLVESFIAENNLTQKREILTSIIYKWAKVEDIPTDSRGDNIDARMLSALEKFLAKDYNGIDNTANPNNQAASFINSAFGALTEFIYAQLVSQTSLKPLFDLINLNYNIDTKDITLDLTSVTQYILDQISANKTNGDNLLSDFDRTLKNLGLKDSSDYNNFYNAFASMDESYKSLLDTSNKNVVYGTNGDDSLDGNSSNEAFFGGDGNDTIYARQGNDIVYGEAGDDYIDVCEGDDIVYGGAGNDTIIAGDGNDIIYGGDGNDSIDGVWNSNYIDGGAGNDVISAGYKGNSTLVGGRGDDTMSGEQMTYRNDQSTTTYIYNEGDGNDTIYLGKGDNYIEFREGITKENILFGRTVEGLFIITFVGIEGSIRINDVPTEVRFSDGTKYVKAEMETMYAKYGTDGVDEIEGSAFAEIIYGYAGNDTIKAGEGDDTIYGGDGDDSIDGYWNSNYIDGGDGNDVILAGYMGNSTLVGGRGNDTMSGEQMTYKIPTSSTTYIYNAGDGNDTIYLGKGDNYIEFGEGITKDNIKFEQNTDGMRVITFNGIDGSIHINGVPSEVRFMDGTKYVKDEIEKLYAKYGTDGSDEIEGSAAAETIYGYAGNDTIIAGDGNDTIYGGDGDDSIDGVWNSNYIEGGDGNDVILAGYMGNSTLVGGRGDDIMTGERKTYNIPTSSTTYIYNVGDGNDTINSGQGDNYIEFGEGINKDNIRFERTVSGARLITFFGKEGSICINNVPTEVRFADGTKYTGDEIETMYTKYGTDSDDVIQGTRFGEKIYGYAGNDSINAGDGSNLVYGGEGNDTIIAGDGNDTVYGGMGNDSIDGTTGSNYLDGGEGDDYIHGGARGHVTLVGGLGDDTLAGQLFSNRYYVGSSEFIYNVGDGNDTIYLGQGYNYITFNEGITKDNINIGKDSENYTTISFDGFDGSLRINGVPNEIRFNDGTSYDSSEIMSLIENSVNNPNMFSVSSYMDTDDNSFSYLSSAQVNKLIQDMTTFTDSSDAEISPLQLQKNNEDMIILTSSGT